MERKKVLMTGASGFIGTNLLDKFVADEYEVLNIDVKAPVNKRHYRYYKSVNIIDYEKLQDVMVFFNPDYIVHLAARTDLGGMSISNYSANTVGVENILKIVRELPNLKKIIITSSQLVCGRGYKPQNQFDYHPTTVYGESKVITEQAVWNNKPNCDWAIIRPTSIWGPWFDIPYKNFFDMIISRHYCHIGKNLGTKTYGYIENAVYQIKEILLSDTLSDDNKVFYVGDYEPTNIEDWANEIANELDYKIRKVPYFFIYLAAVFGDLLKNIGISFPMTTFRLRNMTVDNIVDLSNTEKLAPNLPYTRMQGIRKTLEWLN
jgi:nucleoside-diphosphate-sugar epimerase